MGFFLHGYGGTSKIFTWRTLSSALCLHTKIVNIVASSGITSLLFPGGRTTHLKFKIPVPTLDNSTYNIEKDDEHSQLLEETDLIIWDEEPMCHKSCFEVLDKILKDVMVLRIQYLVAKKLFFEEILDIFYMLL